MSRIVEDSAALVFPSQCVICGRSVHGKNDGLCPVCSGRLPVFASGTCDACGRYLHMHNASCETSGTDPVGRLWSLGYHDFNVARLVDGIKNRNNRRLAEHLGGILREMIEDGTDNPCWDVLTCVPMARHKYRKRQFNPADALARGMNADNAMEYRPKLLRFTRRIKDQKKLTAVERRRNVKGAYAVIESATSELEGKSVLLVDDVTTTGATRTECAKAIAKAGASRIDFATAAVGRGAPLS